jgi:hypothetical protein
MIDLETIIVLTSMTYIVDLDACELHMEDEEVFDKFVDEC